MSNSSAGASSESSNPGSPGETIRIVVASTALCAGFLSARYLYRTYLRRIPNVASLPPRFLRQRSMLGKVTSVGDADNFHFYHTPGGYLAGWGWLRNVPATNAKGLRNQTMHIRLAGVDAPEAAHFGKPAQPYSQEALQWLRSYVLGRRVRVVPLAKDQYGRLVGDARIWKLTGPKNVSREMLRNGCAVVYEAKTGAEFNGQEKVLRHLEERARRRRIGMFRQRKVETPGEYKRKYKT